MNKSCNLNFTQLIDSQGKKGHQIKMLKMGRNYSELLNCKGGNQCLNRNVVIANLENIQLLQTRSSDNASVFFMNFEFEFYFDYMFILTMYALDLQNSETLKDMFTITT